MSPRSPLGPPLLGALALLLFPRAATAEIGAAVHAEGAAAHRVGSSEANEFGWGAAGMVSPEVRWNDAIGVELPLGAVGLSDSDAAPPAGQEEKGSGSALFALPGVRAWPLALAGIDRGLWLAGGGGIARTGDATLPALNVRVGYDLDAGRAALGPFAGILQVVQPEGTLDSEDGRVAMFGLHASYDGGKPERAASDRDGDGIADGADRCPDRAEDKDGFQDADGCPEDDNDVDGLLDIDDACPVDPEDRDGFQDTDGCPENDNDQDRIRDRSDACPNEPEDRDGHEDSDGCPEDDADVDGVSDAVDRCPGESETLNGFADDDGCPDREQVRVVGNSILLDQRIHFAIDQSDIQAQSWGLVKEIAALLKDNPEYSLVHIAGHADDTGTEEYNLRLSEARAKAVKAMLVRDGVGEDRLSVEAYGETKPREAGATRDARRENRRVEFEILARAPREKAQAAPLLPTKEAFAGTSGGAQ